MIILKSDQTILFIRCGKNTAKAFKRFVIDTEAKNYEEALLILLEKAKELKEPRVSRAALETGKGVG